MFEGITRSKEWSHKEGGQEKRRGEEVMHTCVHAMRK